MGQKMFDISDYRIDYIRLRLPEDIGHKMEAQTYWINHATQGCQWAGVQDDCFSIGTYYDKYLRRSLYYFECWGIVSSYVYEMLGAADFKDMMRLDIRRELEDTKIDYDALFRHAKARNKSRSTVKVYSSPFRNKKTGRNSGGETLQIGGDQSQVKLNVYKRGKERPAAELQMEGEALRTLIGLTLAEAITEGWHARDEIKSSLVVELEDRVMERIGYSLDDIEGGVHYVQTEIVVTTTEDALIQMDLLWDELPETAQSAFIEAKLFPETSYAPAILQELDGPQEDASDA